MLMQVGASELMSLYPAVRCFLIEAFASSTLVKKEFQSFMALGSVCDLLAMLMHNKEENLIDRLADQLQAAVKTYLDAFREAYTVQQMRFKHHQLLHIPSQVRRDRLLLSCWALERKHIGAKECFNHYKIATLMPGGALARMVNRQVLQCDCT